MQQLLGNFNPLPRKEGDAINPARTDCFSDFNPLPRKEGDSVIPAPYCAWKISIHSLVKRETYTGICMLTGDDHFNPLPRKEGDF